MEVETKYLATRPDALKALVQAHEIAGYPLEPLPAVDVRDIYLDTEEADLLRQGYVFRLREQSDAAPVATLKSLGPADDVVHRRIEHEEALGLLPGADATRLLDGTLRDALDALVGDAPMQELVVLRQFRTPRVAFDGPRLVGVLSLDLVAQDLPGGPHLTHEAEFELAETGREADLYTLDPVLRARGLQPVALSKLARALLRQQRTPGTRLFLLPEERAALNAFADRGAPLHRRRARVVLLSAQGLRSAIVANKVGLSTARVRHWIDQFRERRLDIFGADLDSMAFEPPPPTSFRVSEIVTGGEPPPALFDEEHFTHPTLPPRPTPLVPPEGAEIIERTVERPVHTPPAEIARSESIGDERAPRARAVVSRFGDGASGVAPEVTVAEPPAEMVAEEQVDTVWTAYPEPLDADAPPLHDIPEEVDSLDALIELLETTTVTTPILRGEPSEERPAPVKNVPAPSARRVAAPSAPRPSLDADEPVVAAAERALRYAFDYLTQATRRFEDEGDAPSVRRALIAVHRVRIALELFQDYLPQRPAKRLHRGLRGLARTLDDLGDLDLVYAHVQDAHDEESGDAQAAFRPVLDALGAERRASYDAVRARLGDAFHAQWLARFDLLLADLRNHLDAGTASELAPEAPDDYLTYDAPRPTRDRLRHMLGSALWSRYEALRAYDTAAEAPGNLEARPHVYPLGVACAGLQYALSLASGCTENTAPAARTLAEVERHLVLVHHARTATAALSLFADAAPVAALRDRLDTLAQEALAEVPTQWEGVTESAFRDALARVVASIGAV